MARRLDGREERERERERGKRQALMRIQKPGTGQDTEQNTKQGEKEKKNRIEPTCGASMLAVEMHTQSLPGSLHSMPLSLLLPCRYR